ncbi:sensor histidine kinase [Spirosoma sp. KNUC1025]|uniref:sensor histidine kinase n=1 Tax=Spirosoma sp. KNUC1025 TaxID=2894082 RepID=UPI0038652B19|nr:histidine kinase [Spirosoma sp. KNUC1025]
MYSRLTSRQKWQLALYLLGLFSPLLLYANLPESARNWEAITRILPFVAAFSLINLLLYYCWITAADWCQGLLFRLFKKDFLGEFSGLSLLTTLVISLILAILYTQALHLTLDFLSFVVRTIWPSLVPKSKTLPFPPEVMAYIQRANNVFSIVIMLSAFYLMINLRAFQQLKDVQLKAERLEKAALLSQFEALKNQLSPHFLFNSLSILTSMVHEDADLSEQYIKQLSKVYRYILEQRDQELVSLKTELDFIRAYTFLLQIRFENKFDVVIDVTPAQQSQYRIAPLSLQLLVENAVKHNRMSVDEPLRVHMYCQDDRLIIENPWQPRDRPEPSTGVGLQNIINRYALLTDLTIGYGQEGDTFVVKIPLLP